MSEKVEKWDDLNQIAKKDGTWVLDDDWGPPIDDDVKMIQMLLDSGRWPEREALYRQKLKELKAERDLKRAKELRDGQKT